VMEFACHEGNDAVSHILSGARASEHDRMPTGAKPSAHPN
jgi:hypothetical protein